MDNCKINHKKHNTVSKIIAKDNTMKNAKELIGYAIKAPSGHNSQPWKFAIDDDTITIYPDFSCALPVVDPDYRELFISLGCAAQNMMIAAAHFDYQCHWEIKQSQKGSHSIVITFNESPAVTEEKLFAFIDKRQTNRSVYTGKSVDNKIIAGLQTVIDDKRIGIYTFQNGEAHFQTLKAAILAGNTIQMSDAEFKKELLAWIRFNQSEVNKLQNGLTYKVMGAPAMPRFIGKAIVKSFLTPEKQNRSDTEKINSSSHFVLLTTKNNTVQEWIALGMTLQKLLLSFTELGIACAYLNPPCELQALAAQLQKQLPINHEYPSILLRIGYAETVPYSPRKDVEKIIGSSKNTHFGK